MKRNNKKGFTIVELVIVIAVIAILAAVLIPTFSGVIDKANKTKDTQLVRNLNTSLALDVGVEHTTMQDALDAVAQQGYDLDKINASAMQAEILWDSHNDVFVYLNGEGKIEYLPEIVLKWDTEHGEGKAKDIELWQICNKMPAPQKYSIYAGNGWSVTSVNDLKVGFDAGKNTNITSVNYVNSASGQSVVIRTNGGTLTIDAKNYDVIHYGYADSVNVIDVATASYHENGEVKFLEVAAGHIVLEADAEVSAVHFTATGEGDAAKFENAEGKKISIDLSKVEEEKMPSFSRDAVTIIEENGTYVAEVKSETESVEYIWLFGQGIKEQMVVTASAGAIAEGGSLKAGVEVGAETGSIAEQIANPAKRNEDGELVDENNEVIDLTDVDFNKADALEDVEVVVEQVASKEDVQIGATLFAGGAGTENDPFLIYDYVTMQKISDLYNKGYYYFVVALEKTDNGTIDCSNWVPININGSFDGKGVKLINIDSILFMNIGELGQNGNVSSWSTTPVTIENFDCYFKLEGDMDAAGGMAKQILGNNTTTLSNINIYGQIVSGSNSGALFSYTTGNPYDTDQNVNQTILINDCMIYATLVSTSPSVAVVSGYPNYFNSNLRLVINNPEEIWQGSASNPNGKIKFVTMSSWTIPEGGTPNQTINCNKLGTVSLTKNSDGSYSVAQTANTTKVKVYISAQLTETDSDGNQTKVAGITMSIKYIGEYDLNGSTQVLEGFNAFNYSNKAKESTASIDNSTLSVAVGGTNNFTFGSIKLVIVETDSNGNVLSYAVKNIVEKTINGDWVIK